MGIQNSIVSLPKNLIKPTTTQVSRYLDLKKLRETRKTKIQRKLREMINQNHKVCSAAQWKNKDCETKAHVKGTTTVWYDVEILDKIPEGCSDKFPGRGYKIRPINNAENRRRYKNKKTLQNVGFENFTRTVVDVIKTDVKQNPICQSSNPCTGCQLGEFAAAKKKALDRQNGMEVDKSITSEDKLIKMDDEAHKAEREYSDAVEAAKIKNEMCTRGCVRGWMMPGKSGLSGTRHIESLNTMMSTLGET